MRLVIQRVREASVTIDGKTVSTTGRGLLVLVGVESGDPEDDMRWLAVSQFTSIRSGTGLTTESLLTDCSWAEMTPFLVTLISMGLCFEVNLTKFVY